MNRFLSQGRCALGIGLAMASVGSASTAFGQAVLLEPNLTPFPAADISLVNNAGTSTLRFSTTSWNNGTGPLELVAGPVLTGNGTQQVDQRIYLSDGTYVVHKAGDFTYHEAHNHIHFDDYADYILQPVDAPGGSELTGQKTTFCIMDTTKVDTRLPGAPAQAVYSTCGSQIQGMSVGWGDTYGAHLAGQEIDVTGAAPGIYQLRIVIDPKSNIVESNENDNVSCVLIDLNVPSSVTVLDVSGSCSAVASITPDSARMGESVQATIVGYGFTADDLAIRFERGNGPRPVATNVVLASDTDTVDMITATITVPTKKQGGKDPVWDLRVGSHVLQNAFTVTQ